MTAPHTGRPAPVARAEPALPATTPTAHGAPTAPAVVPGAGAAAGAAVPARTPPRGVLPALCATQIAGWGVLHYAFPVLLPHITADTGWSPAATTGAFSAGLLVSAAVGVPVGRIIDRRGPRAVMTTGSVLGTASVVLLALAPNLRVFAAAWLLAGIAMAATFYQPAFAALTRWWGPARVRALTVLTLAGGLASTLFAPLTAVLAEGHDWRVAYLVLAAILALVTIPAHALALRAPWPPVEHADGSAPASPARVLRSRPFLMLAAAFTLKGFTVFAVVITLVPLLVERGASATLAAWALGLSGIGQVLGRLLYAPLARRLRVGPRTVLLLGLGAAGTLALGVVPGPLPLLVALAVLVGVIRGNHTLLQATAIADRWGTAHYGRQSAVLAAPVTVAAALAPVAATALAGAVGGYAHLHLILAAVAGVATLLALGGTPGAACRRGRGGRKGAGSAGVMPNPTAGRGGGAGETNAR
ncbi:MFS transporter [Streptomyces sp. ST2-7A]|uniref:MFS transporter n=1 Tax=Streptomyces sp. ST2-7A TaxID=2907214 RepID=UPI001F1F9E06|nr:MFS transporter [Streptomyces sp. ST2-7A]MCE7078856.1 MFS transporter [Streptomyces sp. ST2-7A]